MLGGHSYILEHTGKYATVQGFTSELGKPLRVPVVHGAVAYDNPYTGETDIFVIYNALYFRNMENNLVPPFMMRLAGLEVDECAKFLAKNPTEKNHSIYFPEQEKRYHLQLEGIISYIPTRMPTETELKERIGHYLALTPNVPVWDPHTDIYKDQESAMVDYKGDVKERKEKPVIAAVKEREKSSYHQTDHTISSIASRDEEPIFHIDSIHSGTRVGITPEVLAKRLRISVDQAKKTLKATTQMATRSVEYPSLNRRFHQNDRMLRYVHLRHNTFMDTMFASKKVGKSVRNYTSAQVFATEFGHVFVVCMEDKKGQTIASALKRYFKEIGVPLQLIADGAREQVQGAARVLCQESGCTLVELEKGTPRANRAERYIQMLKNETRDDMHDSGSPAAFWCYCIERRAEIINSVARDNVLLQGQVPHTMMTGRTRDISHVAEFGWYDWCIYRKEDTPWPSDNKLLGRTLGPATNAGTGMSQWVLTAGGQVLPIQTLRHLTPAEKANIDIKRKQYEFDRFIRKRFGDTFSTPSPAKGEKEVRFSDPDKPDDIIYQPYVDLYTGETEEIPETDDIPDYDGYIQAEVLLPQDGEHLRAARVIGKSKDKDGRIIGQYNSNPILNTTVYDVMFPDGAVQQYAANTIAENIFSQVDEEGYRFQLLDHIIDHKKDHTAVEKGDAYVYDKKGNKSLRRTTKGHYFLVAWKDGTESWIPLKELKETNPVDIAEFTKLKGIDDEPAFQWWVPYTLRKKDRIISAVKARVKKKTHMYGVEVPRSVREAYDLDVKNGDTKWRDAISKEMKNVRVAFQILEDGEELDPGRTEVECYMVFVCKMDFTRKARFVANGAKTPDLVASTYAGVVSRESVRIAFVYAALNDLDILSCDIQNAYLQAPVSEKYWTKCGPEFGPEHEGKKALVVRALYGLKCAGRDFRNHLRECMETLNYESCLADPDVWIRKGVKKDGSEYYEWVLIYTDDCLCVSTEPRAALEEINHYFPMKPGSIEPPKIYLGAKISQVQLENGVVAWAMSMSQYVQEAVAGVEKYLKEHDMSLVKGAETPLAANYSPELDGSRELTSDEAAYYQSLIGILRWMIEMGRMDISMEVSAMSSYVAMPRIGHLQQLFRIFSYLKSNHNARLVLDPSYPEIDDEQFPRREWKQQYGDDKEETPANAPKPLGLEFVIKAYVDASHAGCKLTRRSRTGFVVFLNSAPIFWYSKKQGSCEVSTFGSEFVAMKNCVEYLRGLRYKLRMMGIPVGNPCFVFGDNQSVLWNTTIPDSTLKKKSSSVAYHYVREGVSRDEWRTGYINTKDNLSDVMTKTIVSKEDRRRKVRGLLRDIYDE